MQTVQSFGESQSQSGSVVSICDPPDAGILQARILEWVAFPFSRGSSQTRDWTQASRIAGGFFTSWTTGKPKNPGVGSLLLPQGDLLNPGIEQGSPALKEDSLPTEQSGKPKFISYSQVVYSCTHTCQRSWSPGAPSPLGRALPDTARRRQHVPHSPAVTEQPRDRAWISVSPFHIQ